MKCKKFIALGIVFIMLFSIIADTVLAAAFNPPELETTSYEEAELETTDLEIIELEEVDLKTIDLEVAELEMKDIEATNLELARGFNLIDFENNIPGTTSSDAVFRQRHDGSYVLNVNPLLGSASASHFWTLPLNSGNFNINNNEIIEFNFDWWVEHSRPEANSYEFQFLDGNNVLFALGSTQAGNASPWNSQVFFTTGGNRTQVIASTPRLTRFNVGITLNLADRSVSFELRNTAGHIVETRDSIPLSSHSLTEIRFGAVRASGQNWAMGNGATGWNTRTSDYGGKIDNLQINARMGTREFGVINFENDIPGVVSSNAIFKQHHDGSHVLNVNPLVGSATASHFWTLPLDSGNFDVSDKDIIEFNLDWWTEHSRPGANSYEIQFLDGENVLLALGSTQSGNASPWNSEVFFTAGGGGRSRVVQSTPRLTRYNVTVVLNLATGLADFELRNPAGQVVAAENSVNLPSRNLTSLRFGAIRAAGQNWAMGNGATGWDSPYSNYGGKIDNVQISARASEGRPTTIYPSGITLNARTANLEVGAGAFAERQQATFNATVAPSNVSNSSVTWSISNSNVATIQATGNSVTVTARGAGQATLTATSNASSAIVATATIHVTHHHAGFREPEPNFSGLLADGWNLRFGSNFPQNDVWGFTGNPAPQSARQGTQANPVNNYMAFIVNGQSGGRSISRRLPEVIEGSQAYFSFDWRPGTVNINNSTADQNVYDIQILDGARPILSLRTGADRNGRQRVGLFTAAEISGTNRDSFDHAQVTDLTGITSLSNWQQRWFTVGIDFNFNRQEATVIVTERGSTTEVFRQTVSFTGTRITDLRINGLRTAANNLTITGNGFDNMYFFTRDHSSDTVVSVIPPGFLRTPPPGNDGTMPQSWFKTVEIGTVRNVADIGLPATVEVMTYGGQRAQVAVTWEVTEVPWSYNGRAYNPNRQGVFTFTGTLGNAVQGSAVDRMNITPQIFVENRRPAATIVRGAEWLDRGVVAVPVQGGNGILVHWRLLATEYDQNLTFNIYRNGTRINTTPVTTLNFIDRNGRAGDEYQVAVIQTGEISPRTAAWENNFLEIPVQRPASRPNPARAFGATTLAYDIYYTINDMAVADVNGDGQYEILVKWDPSQQRDPGLSNRHTGETIFDLYTLEGELLWRINMGINITSSAHHSSFNFFDLDQDGLAEFAIKTADGTRVFHPRADGTICDLRDQPVYVIGDPNAVWVGGLRNPARNNQVNSGALGRVSQGPEFFTVFNGLTGLPIDTVEYFAPYGINRGNWGDTNNNRSDRFLSGVAFTPMLNNPSVPYPTIIETRGHYGPHFVGAYQLINGRIELVWEFRLADFVPGNAANFSNHSISFADVDRDGFDEIFFGSMALNGDGTPRWIANGTRGTIQGSHGDALHVTPMTPDNEFFAMTPREDSPPNNVVVYNASSGDTLWAFSANSNDVGRGMAANITPSPGFEVWASANTPIYNLVSGRRVEGTRPSINFRIFWDGDLLSELLDGPNNQPLSVTKFNYNTGRIDTIQTFHGTLSNNGTKANPGLQADIFGDWREEVIVRRADNQAIRIYTTNIPTDFVIYTLMHDPAYRLQVNAQNSAYNQPPHLSFYLGEDIRDDVLNRRLPVPNIFFTNRNRRSE